MQNYLAHHGIKGQKRGVRRFQNLDGSLTPAGKKRYGEWKPGKKTFRSETKAVIARASNEVKPFEAKPIDEEETAKRGLLDETENKKCISLAESIFSKASKEEPKITNDIIDSAKNVGSKMYGLEYRLKQPTSLAAKIGADAKEKDLSFEEASKGIKDSVRYTVISDTSKYTDNYNALKNELLEKGYSEVRFKNYFEKYRNGEVRHKAIQCTYQSPDGFEFEVQFHTPESQAVKELKIPLYEEIRKQGVSTERKERLEKEMQDLAERIPDPPGVYELKHSDTLDDVLDDFLSHSAKGTVWKDHKYIKKENGRYYYPEEHGSTSYEIKTDVWDDKELDKIAKEMQEKVKTARRNMQNADDPEEKSRYKIEMEDAQAAYDDWKRNEEKKPKHWLKSPYSTVTTSGSITYSEDLLDNFLAHYGVGPDDNPPGRGSGRYAKGSGKRPFQHDENKDAGEKKKNGLFGVVDSLKQKKAEREKLEEEYELADNRTSEQKAKQLAQAVERYIDPKSVYNTDKLKNAYEVREIANNENVHAARKAYEEADSEFPKYAKDEKTREYYERMAANVRYKLDDFETKYPSQSLEGMEDWYVYDDGDQGSFNSFTCYLIDHGIDVEEYGTRTFEAHKNYDNVREQEVKQQLGSYADKKIGDGYWQRTYADIVSDAVEDYQDSQTMFYFGWYDADWSPYESKHLDEAKKVIEEYKKSRPLNHSDLLDDFLAHYGVGPDDNPPGRGSGRYAKGTGKRPFQHDDAKRAQMKKRGLFAGIQTALAKRKANTEIDKYRDYVDGMLNGSLKNNKALQDKYKELNERTDGKEFDRGPFRYPYNVPDELSGKEADREKLAAEWKKFSEEVVDKHAKAEARSEALNKAREAKAAKQAREAEKAKAIATGDPEQISKWLSEMSDQEQVDAINRIRNTQDIKNKAAAQVKEREDAARAEEQRVAQQKAAEEARKKAEEEANRPKTKEEIRKEKYEKFMTNTERALTQASRIRDMAEKGIDIWNTIAAFNNTFNSEHEMPMIKRTDAYFKEKADKEAAKVRREQQLEDAKTKRENELADALRKEQREDEKWEKDFQAKYNKNSKDVDIKPGKSDNKSEPPKESSSETSKSAAAADYDGNDWYTPAQSIARKLLTSTAESRKEAAEKGVKYWMTVVNGGNQALNPSTERESNTAHYRDMVNERSRYNEWESKQAKTSAGKMKEKADSDFLDREWAKREEQRKEQRKAEREAQKREYERVQKEQEANLLARKLRLARETQESARRNAKNMSVYDAGHKKFTGSEASSRWNKMANEAETAIGDIYDEIRKKGLDLDEVLKKAK